MEPYSHLKPYCIYTYIGYPIMYVLYTSGIQSRARPGHTDHTYCCGPYALGGHGN